MISDLDIYRAAHQIIQQYGDDAEKYALRKMQSFMDDEDVSAASAWLLIAQAISELNQITPNKMVH